MNNEKRMTEDEIEEFIKDLGTSGYLVCTEENEEVTTYTSINHQDILDEIFHIYPYNIEMGIEYKGTKHEMKVVYVYGDKLPRYSLHLDLQRKCLQFVLHKVVLG